MAVPMRKQMEDYVLALQAKIVAGLEAVDPNCPHNFLQDSWVREQGGVGKSCVFSVPHGNDYDSVLEKAGVNVSIIHGKLPPAAVAQMSANHSALPTAPPSGLPFFVAGLSLVIHPRNPHAPTTHANYRYFEVTDPEDPEKILAWWFGGGSDLTPYYLYEEDAEHFHQTIKDVCAGDKGAENLYPAFKKWCDEYFYIPHRQEARGVGGIFFDDLKEGVHAKIPNDDPAKRSHTPEALFELVKGLGDAFLPSYIPILQKRTLIPYTPFQRRWQLMRRGRYVEFNLVVDRGTKFGLMAPGARIESILMTLPETVRWEYMTDMGGEGTEEGKLMAVVAGKPREWVK
ncbi:Coproporphyrinogen oxidase [Mycena chlorophos]|uniref:coproporphyrinogen oxidase n=1 Tax=Mycena chlorophos TaxID=658473 RepID=A0A8H6SJS3_MYCCL|nr:Coproporphyrinogen oxidase [Mycena chlorophos]